MPPHALDSENRATMTVNGYTPSRGQVRGAATQVLISGELVAFFKLKTVT